ncbi:S-layer family protein, partial [Geitlerinema sp. CS-897]|nr:S-layer family protein [Geitlerinema sp. CS-897]
LNPNGIVFGPNARLDLGGSFFATTANSIVFENGLEFNATNPENSTALLSVNVPLGLQFGGNPGDIVVRGNGTNFPDPVEGETLEQAIAREIQFQTDLLERPTGLRVATGETLALVGGNLTLEGGILKTPSGRIELGSVAENARVAIASLDRGWTLDYAEAASFRDLALSQEAGIVASGEGGGEIRVRGGNVSLGGESLIFADTLGSRDGIGIDLTARQVSLRDGSAMTAISLGSGAAGTLNVTALQALELEGDSSRLQTDTFGEGNAGNLVLDAARLSVTDRAFVSAGTSAQGNAGDLTVNASESVEVSHGSILLSAVQPEAGGEGGNLTLNTARLSLNERGFVSSGTFGQGNAGDLTVNASESIDVRNSSFLDTSVFSEAVGDAGDAIVNTARLSLTDEGSISTETSGRGNAGDLTVNASESVEVRNFSSLSSAVDSDAVGEGGSLTLNTARLSVADGGFISTRSFGSGNSGNLTIDASDRVTVAGFGTLESGQNLPSQIATFGGNISIQTSSLDLSNGGQINADAISISQGGTVEIVADRVSIDGFDTISLPEPAGALVAVDGANLSSRISAVSGTIAIEAREITAIDGGSIDISAASGSTGGNVTLAADTVRFDGVATRFFENSDDEGGRSLTFPSGVRVEGGTVDVRAREILLTDGAHLNAIDLREGRLGSVRLTADRLRIAGFGIDPTPRLDDNGNVLQEATTFRSEILTSGGGVRIQADRVEMNRLAQIDTGFSRLSVRDPQPIEIQATSIVLTEGSRITTRALSEESRSGDIQITAENIVLDGSMLDPFSSLLLQSEISSNESNRESASEAAFAGNISISTNSLSLTNGGSISAASLGGGNSGNIDIIARDFIAIDGVTQDTISIAEVVRNLEEISLLLDEDTIASNEKIGLSSSISTSILSDRDVGEVSQFTGSAGNISIATDRLVLSNEAEITSDSFRSRGSAGNIDIRAREFIEVTENAEISSGTVSSNLEIVSGSAGRIRIETEQLFVRDSASINVDSGRLGEGGGNLDIQVGNLWVSSGGSISSNSLFGNGDAGTIRIRARGDVWVEGFGEGNSITTNAGNQYVTSRIRAGALLSLGRGGAIDIEARSVRAIDGGFISSMSTAGRGAGEIRIQAREAIEIAGRDLEGDESNISSSARPATQREIAGLTSISETFRTLVEARQTLTGDAGNIDLQAPRIELSEGAEIVTDSDSRERSAGTIRLSADFVSLTDDATISSNTFGSEGNLQIDTGTLILRRNSGISTNAEGDVPGGNITIDTETLAALENSDITANARNAEGGRVTIDARGIFGTQFRNQLTPESDITATSELGADFSGTVELNTPDIDTAAGLVDLAENPVDAAAILDTDPCATGRDSEFYITGRGGLPLHPEGTLPGEATWVDLRSPNPEVSELTPESSPETAPLVEAQSWHVNDKGQVVLSANTADAIPNLPQRRPTYCSPQHRTR